MTTGSDVVPGAEFIAGARVIRLMASILADGPTERLRAEWRAFPELADLWPGGPDPDEAAADHQELFGFSVHPIEGVFRDKPGEEGSVAGELAREYAESGFEPGRGDLRPDHLAVELSFVAHALEQGPRGAVTAREFLDERLFSWLPAFVFAVENQGRPAYAELGRFLLEWLSVQRDLLDVRLGPGETKPAPTALEIPNLTQDDRTSVRDLAEFLTSPASSGLYLGRSDVARLSKSTRAPGGFGGRRLMMENVLRSAARYDGLGPFFAELDDLAVETSKRWVALEDRPAGRWARVWTSRIATTRGMLAEMERLLTTQPGSPSASTAANPSM